MQTYGRAGDGEERIDVMSGQTETREQNGGCSLVLFPITDSAYRRGVYIVGRLGVYVGCSCGADADRVSGCWKCVESGERISG